MARLYGQKEDIDSEKVKNFFDERAQKEVGNIISKTMYQDKEIVEKRQHEETNVILANLDLKNKKILEIGCGTGRWSELFHDKCESYLGIDYSKNLIRIAHDNYTYENCHFQEMSATEITRDNLIIKPPFDLIFITGVLMYLNDEEVEKVIKKINAITHSSSKIYIRETTSKTNERLTLKDFYSTELQTDYNAIYRTEKELMAFIKRLDNVSNIKKSEIYAETNTRDETCFKYFLISKQ